MWRLVAEVVELSLAARFTIASRSWDTARNVFVTLTCDGETGVGESSPDTRWGESCEAVISELESAELDRLRGPFDLEGVLGLLPPGAARAALDIALHDLAAKRAGLSVSELLGVGGRPPPPTSVTLPIAAVEVMVARARSLAHLPILKMKVGFDGDVDAVGAVRQAFSGRLRIDANEGWTVADALERLAALESYDIELCEQPIQAGAHHSLKRVTESTAIPVFADEDVSTSGDVAALAGVVNGVNLKLRKSGGIREAVRAIAVARAHGLEVMLGCDLESGVAATAQAHVAPLVDYADIDGPLLLARDPWAGVSYERGMPILPRGAGLGVSRAW
jgi:L-Ala-D/L-Glu epimerase